MTTARILLLDGMRAPAGVVADALRSAGHDVTRLGQADARTAVASDFEHDMVVIDAAGQDGGLPAHEVESFLAVTPGNGSQGAAPVILIASPEWPDGLNGETASRVTFRVCEAAPPASLLHIAGTLGEWQGRVARAWSGELDVVLNHLVSGEFRFRTLSEAKQLSLALSQCCPRPADASAGLQELTINAIEHGNLGIDHVTKANLVENGQWLDEIERRLSLPEHAGKVCTLVFRRSPDRVHIEIQDQGEGFESRSFVQNDGAFSSGVNGRGIFLVKNLYFDRIHYEDGGRRVVVEQEAAVAD